MTLTEFFYSIGAPTANAGATEAEIFATEKRLAGQLPDAFRAWFLEADGFEGEAETCLWRFHSLQYLQPISTTFPATSEILISKSRFPDRRAAASEYVVFCDAFIYLPFYAINIHPGSPYYSEVISASEETPADANFVAPSFEAFTKLLFEHANDGLFTADD